MHAHLFFLRLVLILLFCVFPLGVRTAYSAGGVSVIPSILRVDVFKEAPVADLLYSNHTSESVELRLSAKNFTALEDGRKVQLLERENSENLQYGLASWISFEQDSLVLVPGETKQVKVFFDTTEMTPGAHYASVQAQIHQEKSPGNLGLRGVLSSLLFVRGASGESVESGTIQNLTVTMDKLSFPTSASMTFNNTGNVEAVPYGELLITSSRGSLVGKGIVNTDSLITLPSSIRTYTIPIRTVQSLIWPGYYTLELKAHIDQNSTPITYSRTIFSLGSISWQQLLYGVLLIFLLTIAGIIRLRRRLTA